MIQFWERAALTCVLAFFAGGVQAQTPDGTLFYDDFTRPGGVNDLTPWKVLGGLWSVSTGKLLGSTNGLNTSPTNHHADLYVTNSWNHYSVEVTASVPTNCYGWAVGGRLNPVTGSYYEVFLYANYAPPEPWRLKLSKHTVWGPTGFSGANLNFKPDVPLVVNTVNRTDPHTIKMTFQGNRIMVHFDDDPVAKFDEVDGGFEGRPYYSSGGILVGMYNTNNSVLSVDEVIVKQLGPMATNQVVVTPEDTATNLVLQGSIVSGTKTFAIPTGGNPTNGTLSGLDPTTGAVTYTPNSDYVGPDAFLFTVGDGTLYATGLVSITVTPPVLVHQAIAGTVSYYAEYPPSGPSAKRLGDVTIDLTGDTNLSTLTLGDGSFSVAGVAGGGTYGVTPSKTDDSTSANGVTTLDIALIRQHILSPASSSLTTPYKRLAADVNGSSSVSTLDIALIRQVILGGATQFPAGLWRFVPADYVFPDATTPWTAPNGSWHTNLTTSLAAEDFVAIKLGDVNDSWAMPVGMSSLATGSEGVSAASLTPPIRFQIGNQIAQRGASVTVPITVRDFQEVTSAQFTLVWDAAVLKFEGVGNFGLSGLSTGNFGVARTAEGKLTLSWNDPGGAGVTMADGTVVFTMSFEVTGPGGSVSALTLGDAPTLREASVNLAVATIAAEAGEVRVMDVNGLRLSEAAHHEGRFELTVPTELGRRYVLEFTDQLPATDWTALPGVEGDGKVLVLSDSSATNHHRFYRVRVE